jgi:hypothetical protein
MLSRAVREEKAQQWLERLQAWEARSGGMSLARFAREQGWKDFDAYRWARILRRQGRWDKPAPKAVESDRKRRSAAAKFVRVRLAAKSESIAPVRPLTLRLQLANGRSGEVELGGTEQLLQVLAALEHSV